MSKGIPRKMIRLYGEESEQETKVELPDAQEVPPHRSSDTEYTSAQGGVRFQRCGGGRRRLPHKSGGNY